MLPRVGFQTTWSSTASAQGDDRGEKEGAGVTEPTQTSAPVLRTVVDVQDFDSISFHGIDHDVRERRKRQFFSAAPVAGPASVR